MSWKSLHQYIASVDSVIKYHSDKCACFQKYFAQQMIKSDIQKSKCIWDIMFGLWVFKKENPSIHAVKIN